MPVLALPTIATAAAWAVGRSFSTTTFTVVVWTRPWFVALTVTWYVPARVGFGSASRSVVAVAVQPSRLVLSSAAVQPDGSDPIERLTRSKKVALRPSVSGTATAPPASPTAAGSVATIPNVPSGPSRETSSSFSWVESGSVDVFQLRLPRYWSASLTCAGVASGRLALYSATAPVTAGVAIDVPDE